MDVTSTGRFRVLASPRDRPELLLIDVDGAGTDGIGADGGSADAGAVDADAYAPTYVPTEGYEGAKRDGEDGEDGGDERDGGDRGDLAEAIASLRPGYLIDATLAWADGDPRFADVTVVRRTRIEFVDGVTGLFEAARETWREAAAAGEAMNSRVTRNTDGDPNGVVYVFAEQSGARDLFEEFRSGLVPIEPLVARVNEGRGPAEREVFVMRPADGTFVLVYIVLEKGGLLAETVRDTYEIPREG